MLTFSRDRISSLKAAGVGAIALCAARLAIDWAQASSFDFDLAQLDLWLGTALCGGVFGLTYRYTLREERDIHLTTGAIAAFAIARAAGQWEGLQANEAIGWIDVLHELVAGHWQAIEPLATTLSALAIANGIPFGVAALAIDAAFSLGWVDRCAGDRSAVAVTEAVRDTLDSPQEPMAASSGVSSGH